jgi:uncharacterized membrane protein (DUF106 family)
VKILRRIKYDAKASSLINISVWLSSFSVSIIALIGVIKDNPISFLVLDLSNKNNPFYTCLIFGVIIFIIFRIRYYKIMDVEDIKRKLQELPKRKLLLMKVSVCVFQIAVPVFGYIVERLYWYGHI